MLTMFFVGNCTRIAGKTIYLDSTHTPLFVSRLSVKRTSAVCVRNVIVDISNERKTRNILSDNKRVRCHVYVSFEIVIYQANEHGIVLRTRPFIQ